MSISGLMSDKRVVNNHRLTKSKALADNDVHEIRSISIWQSSKDHQGHRNDKQAQERAFFVISAVFTVALLLVYFTWVDNAQIPALKYTFTSTSSNVLKAYIRLTGIQFLIINKNQFDWINVRVDVNSDISQDHPLHRTIDPRPFMLTIPRINSGEAYSVEVTEFRREDGAKLAPETTPPESIKILSDTPLGRGSWYGKFVQPPAVAD